MEKIPPTRTALKEALTLSEEVLEDIELSRIPLTNIALKVCRIARLMNDITYQRIMEYEASGYPTTPSGVPPDVYTLAKTAKREYRSKKQNSNEEITLVFLESIEELERQVRSADTEMQAARDPDISIRSSNPTQFVQTPFGNQYERNLIRERVAITQGRLSSRRAFLHSYTSRRYYELKYSDIAGDIFARIRGNVDSAIGRTIPEAAMKFSAVYEGLQSTNPENWANAVHSCRRILQELADVLYPPAENDVRTEKGSEKIIQLGKDNYINRIVAYIETNAESKRFREIVGSHLKYIGERLDSIFKAAQKGSHGIVTKEEADRYVVYTYMIVGDILSLN